MRKHKGPRSHPESDTPTGNKKKTRSAKCWELMQMGVTTDPSQSGEHPSELVGKQRYMAWVHTRNYVSLMFDTDGNGTRRMHCWLWTIFLHAPVKKWHHLSLPTVAAKRSDSESVTQTKKKDLRKLILQNGEVFTFTEADIPQLCPTIPTSFEEIACTWDDTSPRWAGSSSLIIKNTPIAIKRGLYTPP